MPSNRRRMCWTTPAPARAAFAALAGCVLIPQPAPLGAQEGVRVASVAPRVLVGTDTIWDANSTALRLGGEMMLVDNFMLRSFTRSFVEEARGLLGVPGPAVVVNTHGHDDHTWGNQLFPGTPILGHAETARYMGERVGQMARFLRLGPRVLTALDDSLSAADLDSGRRTRLEMRRDGIATNLERHRDVRVTPPGVSFVGDTTIVVGGTEVVLLDVSPAHSYGDVAVLAPSLHVLLVGDLARSRGLTGLDADSGNLAGWVASLRRLLRVGRSREALHVIPGHGPVGGLEILEEALSYWSAIQEGVAAARERGLGLEEAKELLELPGYRSWTHYELLHEANVEAAWAQGVSR